MDLTGRELGSSCYFFVDIEKETEKQYACNLPGPIEKTGFIAYRSDERKIEAAIRGLRAMPGHGNEDHA